MIANLVNIFSRVMSPNTTNAIAPLTQKKSDNPFGNPFMENTTNDFYGKNNPVRGGYFAGYYNNKPNIVGKRLFIEV